MTAFIFGVLPSTILGGVMGGLIGKIVQVSSTPLSEGKIITIAWSVGLVSVILFNGAIAWWFGITEISEFIDVWTNGLGVLLSCPSLVVLMVTGWMVRELNESYAELRE